MRPGGLGQVWLVHTTIFGYPEHQTHITRPPDTGILSVNVPRFDYLILFSCCTYVCVTKCNRYLAIFQRHLCPSTDKQNVGILEQDPLSQSCFLPGNLVPFVPHDLVPLLLRQPAVAVLVVLCKRRLKCEQFQLNNLLHQE